MRRATCTRCGGPKTIPRTISARNAEFELIQELVLLCHPCIHRGLVETKAAHRRQDGTTRVFLLEELWALPTVPEPARRGAICPDCDSWLDGVTHYLNCENGGKRTWP